MKKKKKNKEGHFAPRKFVAGEVVAAVAFVAILGVSFTTQIDRMPVSSGQPVIVAFGDSITTGFGLPPEAETYVDILSRELKIPVINAGRTGDTTGKAFARLERDVLSRNPNIVLILLGGNDFLERIPLAITSANLRQMITVIQDRGARVILMGLNMEFIPQYEEEYRDVAQEKLVAGYVPGVLDGIISSADLLSDEIHPNERGHQVIAERILPVLRSALKTLP